MARKYRKICPRIWNDEKFLSLSDQAKLVFFFLLTHPHMTPLGAMRTTISGLASEMGWEEKVFKEAFREVLTKGLAKTSGKAAFIWLPNFLKYNPPESPNVVTAWRACIDDLPECPLLIECLKTAAIAVSTIGSERKAFAIAFEKAFREDYPKAFGEALSKTTRKTMPNQEQEQEQEQEQVTGTGAVRKDKNKPPLFLSGKTQKQKEKEANFLLKTEIWPRLKELQKKAKLTKKETEEQTTLETQEAYLVNGLDIGEW